jgi:hypothetical protein
MKIWTLPPQYLDDVTLLEEHTFSYMLFHAVREYGLYDAWSDLDEFTVYMKYQPYVFLRHEMLEDELRRRKLSFVSLSIDPNEIVGGSVDFPVNDIMVEQDINELMGWWESNLDVVGDGAFIENLTITPPFVIYEELVHLQKVYCQEYGL